MFAFVMKREDLDKPTGTTDNLCALSSRDNAAAMQALLQEDPAVLDQVYQSDGVAGLLALVRTPIECYRCKGAHYKWQFTATPSMEEQGERDPRKWGPVSMCVLDPFKALKRSVFALSGRDSTSPDIVTHAALSTSIQEMRTDMGDLIQTVKEIRLEVEGALHALTTMTGSLNTLALNVQALQH